MRPALRNLLVTGSPTLIQRAISLLRRTNATVWLPGIGNVQGLTTGNYLDSAGVTPATVDNPVGLDLDAAGSLGPELVVNGDFSGGTTGWVMSGNWAITGGVATHTSSAGADNLQRLGILTIGIMYRISVDVRAVTGTLTLMCGTGATSVVSGTGTAVVYLTCATSVNLLLQTAASSTCTIDNISVREVTGIHALQATTANKPVLRRGVVTGGVSAATGPWWLDTTAGTKTLGATFPAGHEFDIVIDAVTGVGATVLTGQNLTGAYTVYGGISATELVVNGGFDSDTAWTKDTGWGIAGGVATHTAGSVSNIKPSVDILVVGKPYVLTYTVTSRSAGTFMVFLGSGTNSTAVSVPGTYSFFGVCAGDTKAYMHGDAAFAGSIDNISVREVLPGTSGRIIIPGTVAAPASLTAAETVLLTAFVNRLAGL